MSERIQSTGSPAGSGARSDEAQDPPQGKKAVALDRAAADFAALLGAEPQGGEGTPSGMPHELPQASSLFGTENDESSSAPGDMGGGATEFAATDRKPGDGDERNRALGDDSGGGGQFPSPGDAILQGFSHVGESAAPAEQSSPARALDGIAQQVADQILVSEASSGAREVRIVLKDSILPGTEIRISQQAGQLQIQLVTDSQRSHEMLLENHAALQTCLTERLANHDVVVQVAFDSQDPSDDQGRSRQQRNVREELEES